MSIPFYGNNPVAMGTQSPATLGMMRGLGVLANGPAPAPQIAVPTGGGQMQNLAQMQGGGQQGPMGGQQVDPATLQRLMQMMGGGGGNAFPSAFGR